MFVYKHFYYKLFDERPWYHVLGFLVVGLGPAGCADRQQRASSLIHGLLPSTSPYDIIDDGPTWVNFNRRDTRGNTTGLSYGLLRFLMKFHVWQCLYLVQAAGLSFLSRRLKLFRREHPLDLTG